MKKLNVGGATGQTNPFPDIDLKIAVLNTYYKPKFPANKKTIDTWLVEVPKQRLLVHRGLLGEMIYGNTKRLGETMYSVFKPTDEGYIPVPSKA